MLKTFLSTRWFHPLLLLVWIAIGTGLRFTQLTGKSPWTDEFATLVFSLGNSYQTLPLDQAISLDTLLQPLQANPTAGASAVIHHLVTEDHHPPLYFVLAHWWMQLFPTSGTYVSLWAARSLPAVFGVISIPAVYGLGWLAFRSRLAAQLAAAMMAVSPFGIFLAQEARHYALGILWVIASLCGLVVAVQHLKHRTALPIWVVLYWVVVNSLGIATHYFFTLTLCAEAIVLAGFWIKRNSKTVKDEGLEVGNDRPFKASRSYLWRISAVAAGTFVGCIVWLPVWHVSHDTQMTQWIAIDNRLGLSLISPIFQAIATWITMLSLLPVEASTLLVVIASGVVMLGFFIWAVPIFYRGVQALLEEPDTGLATSALGGFVLGAIAIFFGITYFLGTDLTRGARYNFVYFPAVIVLLGAAMAVSWNAPTTPNSQLAIATGSSSQQHKKLLSPFIPDLLPFITPSQKAVVIIWLMGLLSSITVVSNLGYQKYYRPDLLVPVIQKSSSVPILIATTHNTLVQTGEIMGLAWEFKDATNSQEPPVTPQFLLAHQDQDQCVSDSTATRQEPVGHVSVQETTCPAVTTLQKTLAQLPRPLDLWLVNFKASLEREAPNCFAEDVSQYQTSVDGYASRLYHCLADNTETSQRL